MSDQISDQSQRARIGIVGGSGLYRLFDDAPDAVELDILTPYGPTSSPVTIGTMAGKRVAFLTRHGRDHSVAPHLINYRANVWALASLGVRAVLSSSAVGSISSEHAPGALIVPDQIIDRTHGRRDTFFDEGEVQHLPFAEPFDPALRAIANSTLEAIGETFAPTATAVIIQGPRFSSRAEAEWFRSAGGHIVNMTLYPEVALAAELGMGALNLSFATDSDIDEGDGAEGEGLSADLVFVRLREAQPRIIAAIESIIAALPDDYEPPRPIAADAVARVLARPVSS
ncbi:MTAP family purine nucleoside phosphorylase [Amnibacterium flavum]|uniref:MTAP family purine nucleoside phosphorylase n=1 Tax=Amnibacterium flavum TaxID=2173173 RepID=UPI001F0BE863|nr:MTAP family purine nucleoside phosphorylase [Amnibacterium flavum]